MVAAALRISDDRFSQVIKNLADFVKIPSLSNIHTAGYSMANLEAAANFAKARLADIGLKAELIRVNGSAPYVVAEKIVDAALPTLLFYGHYDIQPVEKEKWTSDPFVVQERDGRLYGRGTADDKGGIVAIIAALGTYLSAKGKLPVNVKVLFEGEEEYGSSNMKAFIGQHAARINAHAVVILDGTNRDAGTGSLTSSTRGIVNLKLTVNALQQPVHSGKGCIAPDPTAALACVVASLFPVTKIPGLTDGHVPVTAAEQKLLDESTETTQEYSLRSGVNVKGDHLRGNPKESVFKRVVDEPSVSVLNFTSGKPNGGNSIQDKAVCDIGIRIMAGQDPQKVANAVVNYLKAQPVLYNLPLTVDVVEADSYAWKGDITNPFSAKYLQVFKNYFGKSAVLPTGGTLPLLKDIEDAFHGKMHLMVAAVADDQSAIHSHNESQDIKVLRNSIDALMAYLDEAATIKVPPLDTPSTKWYASINKVFRSLVHSPLKALFG